MRSCTKPLERKSTMKTLMFATVAVLGAAGTANAFTKSAGLPLDTFTHLECVPSFEQPRTPDSNPTYKIMVDLSLNDAGNDVTSLTATHVLADGSAHDRDDQYNIGNVWAKKGYTEWYWNGYRNRNPNIKMGGRLYRQANGLWFYEETQFKNNQQIWFMSSRCHVDNA